MWCPTVLEGPEGRFEAPLPQTGRAFNFTNSQGMMYEAAEVRRCLVEGEHEVNKPKEILKYIYKIKQINLAKKNPRTFLFDGAYLTSDQ